MADDEDEVAKVRAQKIRLLRDQLGPAYNFCFNNAPHGRTVVSDLIEFCCGNQTTCTDPLDIHETLLREGRRQVLLHIMRFANLDAEQIFKIYYKLV